MNTTSSASDDCPLLAETRQHALLELSSWYSRVHDRRYHAVHMILVAEHTILPRHAGGVTGLAQILFHLTKVRCEALRIGLLIALQIGSPLFKLMAGQTPPIFHDAEV